MIGRLTGTLAEKNPPQVLVDCHGVGYEVDVPMSTFYQLPPAGVDVALYTHLVVREDAHQLYGFATEQEKRELRDRALPRGMVARDRHGARAARPVRAGRSDGGLVGHAR